MVHCPQVHDLLPQAINELFCRNEQIHNYITEQRKDLHPVKIKTSLYNLFSRFIFKFTQSHKKNIVVITCIQTQIKTIFTR